MNTVVDMSVKIVAKPKERVKMELQSALKIVIAYLDGLMEEAPSQEVADVHNFLIDLVKIK